MSTFRPPQVPQQPRTFFTPGTASGVPPPNTWQQQAAYFPGLRAMHEEIAQTFMRFTAATAAAVPPTTVPVPAPAPRPMIAEQFATATDRRMTAGTAAGVPAPRTMDQTPAYWRPARQQVAEEAVLIPENLTVGSASAAPPPTKLDQTAAYWRPARQQVAEEWIITPTLFTAGGAAGVPIARVFGQDSAYFRARIEIQQPAIYSPQVPPATYVPPVPLQMPEQRLRPMFVEIEETLPLFTPGTSSGVPPPRAMDQTAAYWRFAPAPLQLVSFAVQAPVVTVVPPPVLQSPDRRKVDDLAPLAAIVLARFAPIPPAPSFVPYSAPQPIWTARAEFAPYARAAAAIQVIAAGAVPRQAPSQAAAYFRPHIEILQPVFQIAAFGFVVITASNAVITARARRRLMAFERETRRLDPAREHRGLVFKPDEDDG